MKLSIDQLAQGLASELGAEAVSADLGLLAARMVDDKLPNLLCRPASAADVAAALRLCAAAQATVVPWGGGTAMAIGNPPRQANVIIDLKKLDRVIEHDPANLTATVQGGITLSTLQAALVTQRQFAPIEGPFPERATVGGTVAANLNGPRRSFYGSVRDLVIGMKVALVSGEQIKAGGKVVKNVAGYDMCKLFVGSLGSLGIITEVTVRVAPIPETAKTVITSGNLAQAVQFIDEVSRSALLPAAVFLLNDGARKVWQVAIRCEGFAATVARHLRDLEAVSNRIGVNAEKLPTDNQNDFWSGIRDLPLSPDRLVFRVTLPRAAIAEFLQIVQDSGAPAIVSDVATGTIWLAYEPKKTNTQRFSELTALARERRGHAAVFAAPAELKQGIEVWGSAPPAFSLMREIKRQFDPKGLLNPGRFVGNL